MDGSDIIAHQQKDIIGRLEKDFAKLRQENSDLHNQMELITSNMVVDRQFEEITLPILINQRLAGQNIAVVASNKSYLDKKWCKALIDNLKEAGATIHSVVALPQDLGLTDEAKRERIVTELGISLEKDRELFPFLTKRLAREIGIQQEKRVITVLEEIGIARVFSGVPGPISSIIVIGGGTSPKEGTLDKLMIQQWKRLGLRVIGVEPNDTKVSFMFDYQKLGLSTVDSIDKLPSQVTLIWLLQQGKEGNYGMKSTAEQLFPDIITY